MENQNPALTRYNEIQAELDSLRAKGENLIVELQAEVSIIKRNKKLPKEAKMAKIQKLNESIKDAKAFKTENNAQVKSLVKDAKFELKSHYSPIYKAQKQESKDTIKQLKDKYKADLQALKATQQQEKQETLSSISDPQALKAETKRLKLIHKNQLSELKLTYQEDVQKEKNKYHNIYLEYTNGLKQATNDQLNVLEVVNGKAENYAYNFNIKDFLMKNGLYIIIVIFMIVCICINNRLISINSIMTILGTFSTKVFFALGVAGLILLAGTDLSIGRMVTLGSLFTCMILNPTTTTEFFGISFNGIYESLGFVPAFIIALLIAVASTTLFAAIAGFFSAKFKIHPFITTLGTSLIIWGIAGYGTDNVRTGTVSAEASATVSNIFRVGSFPGIPLTLIYAIVAIAIVWFIWNKTTFGKNMYAVGGNPEAASVSGISVFKTTLLVFIMAGILYGFGSFFVGLQTGSSSSTLGQGWEMEAIAACVVGGISFSGGIGKISGAVIGCLLFEILKYYLRDITGGSSDITNIFIGVIIVVAVVFDSIKYLKKK